MRVKVFAYVDPHDENLDCEEVVFASSSADFTHLNLDDLAVLDVVESIASEYEEVNNVTIDHGGDENDYHLDLPDVFDTREEAEQEARKILAAMVSGLKAL